MRPQAMVAHRDADRGRGVSQLVLDQNELQRSSPIGRKLPRDEAETVHSSHQRPRRAATDASTYMAVRTSSCQIGLQSVAPASATQCMPTKKTALLHQIGCVFVPDMLAAEAEAAIVLDDTDSLVLSPRLHLAIAARDLLREGRTAATRLVSASHHST